MALLLPVNDVHPRIGDKCYLAPNATVVGDVMMGDECSVWFNAVVRGDVNKIVIGHKTNIQDGAIIHCTYQTAETLIGDNVSIGHRAIVHGCTIMDNVLIGMGAIVMDHAVVHSGSIIAAGAVILENTIVQGDWIYAGVPAKPVKQVSNDRKTVFERTAGNYLMYSGWYGSSSDQSK